MGDKEMAIQKLSSELKGKDAYATKVNLIQKLFRTRSVDTNTYQITSQHRELTKRNKEMSTTIAAAQKAAVIAEDDKKNIKAELVIAKKAVEAANEVRSQLSQAEEVMCERDETIRKLLAER